MSGRNGVEMLVAPEITRPPRYITCRTGCNVNYKRSVRNGRRNGKKRKKNHITDNSRGMYSRGYAVRRNAPAGNQTEHTEYRMDTGNLNGSIRTQDVPGKPKPTRNACADRSKWGGCMFCTVSVRVHFKILAESHN